MKPTEEQIKEFWEKCGFSDESYTEVTKNFGDVRFSVWRNPIGYLCQIELPPIDLNNLFKYTPNDYQQVIFQPEPEGGFYCGLTIDDKLYEGSGSSLELSYFWARWEAIHER